MLARAAYPTQQRSVEPSATILNKSQTLVSAVSHLGSSSWEEQIQGLIALRQAVDDAEAETLRETLATPQFVDGVVLCLSALRSGVVRHAMQTIEILLEAGYFPCKPPFIDRLVHALVPKLTEEKRFVADGAAACLSLLARVPKATVQTHLATCLARFTSHCNSRTVAHVSQLMLTATTTLRGIDGLTPSLIRSLVPSTARMLGAGLSAARFAGRSMLQMFQEVLDDLSNTRGPTLDTLIHACLRPGVGLSAGERRALEDVLTYGVPTAPIRGESMTRLHPP